MRISFVSFAVAILAGASLADDWPNFRGPLYDGICRETGLTDAFSGALKPAWQRDLGSAFSSFAVVDGKLFTCGTRDKQQVVYCLSADTGEPVWQFAIEPEYIERSGGDGTRGTPTVNDGRVYVQGARGRLVCLKADSGELVWDRKFSNEPHWGYSGSVLVEGDLAIVTGGKDDGALIAFDKATGKQAWKTGKDLAGYATPYPFTFNGKRYIAGFVGQSAMIVEAATGREAWSMKWETDWDVNAAAPIFHDGLLLFTSGYNHGAILLRLKADGDRIATDTVWESRVLRNRFQSPVLIDGYLYTGDETGLKCVQFATGKQLWSERRLDDDSFAYSTVVAAEGNLFVLLEKGKMAIAPATPTGFKPVATASLFDGKCWTVSVISNGRLYARDLDRMACFDLRAKTDE